MMVLSSKLSTMPNLVMVSVPMIKSFTPNDLIRYIYQEMSEVEQELLMQALHSDDALMQEYIELLSTVEFLEQVKLQLTRDCRPLPTMKINPAVKDIFGFTYEDFELLNYDPHPHIKGEVAV